MVVHVVLVSVEGDGVVGVTTQQERAWHRRGAWELESGGGMHDVVDIRPGRVSVEDGWVLHRGEATEDAVAIEVRGL